MNQRPSQLTRFRVMAAMALAVLAIYLVVLFNTQVVHHEEYLAKSIQTITTQNRRRINCISFFSTI